MKNKFITSIENPFIKNLMKLKKNESDEYVFVEGKRSVEMFLNSELYEIKEILVTEDFDSSIMYGYENLKIVSENIMKKISGMVTAPGVFGVFKKKYFKDEIFLENSGTYVLYKMSDPGNLGAIIRTAVALNRKYLILIDGCHYHNQKVVQSSAGMISNIKIFRMKWENFISYKEKKNLSSFFGLDSKGKNIFLEKSDFEKSYLVIGNEANGIPKEVEKIFSALFSLPMSKKCESLNASVAAAVAGYKIWSLL